jgi:hypothetical protein
MGVRFVRAGKEAGDDCRGAGIDGAGNGVAGAFE